MALTVATILYCVSLGKAIVELPSDQYFAQHYTEMAESGGGWGKWLIRTEILLMGKKFQLYN